MTLASFALRRCHGDRCTLCTRPRLGLICSAWPRRSSRLRARKLSRSCVMTCPPPTPSTGALPILRGARSPGSTQSAMGMHMPSLSWKCVCGILAHPRQLPSKTDKQCSAYLNLPRQDFSWQTCRDFHTTSERGVRCLSVPHACSTTALSLLRCLLG